MALLTTQRIGRYYEAFRDVDLIFTKEVIKTVGLLTKNVYLKYVGRQIPCVVYSTSMSGAKVIANVKSDTFAEIRNSGGALSLRFSFLQSDKPDPLSFFVSCRIVGYSPYGTGKQELNFVSLSYPQRPSDDLISILGSLLETNTNSKKRREERIIVSADNASKLGLKSTDSIVYIQNVARKCIVRDLSFSGARMIIPGAAKFLHEKQATLQLELDEVPEPVKLSGSIVRVESVADREDITAIAIAFEEAGVSLAYKMRISAYLSTNKKPPAYTAVTGE